MGVGLHLAVKLMRDTDWLLFFKNNWQSTHVLATTTEQRRIINKIPWDFYCKLLPTWCLDAVALISRKIAKLGKLSKFAQLINWILDSITYIFDVCVSWCEWAGEEGKQILLCSRNSAHFSSFFSPFPPRKTYIDIL